MPVMNGIDALIEIRKNSKFNNLPVIVQTGDDELEEAVKKLNGIYLSKMNSSLELLEKEVEKALKLDKI